MTSSNDSLARREFTNVDFKTSQYKHINNGGVTSSDVMPYNVDAITGATITVAGPAVSNSIPLSMREIENTNECLFRGVYEDESGPYVYEGLDLFYLLNSMTRGDKGIILTDTATHVLLKDENRNTVVDISIEDITKAHNNGKPYLLAYGKATLDEEIIAPFVFDGETSEIKSEGYVFEIDNGGGCLKLVYETDDNESITGLFQNVAYIYICEAYEPGYKHTANPDSTYSSSRYTDYIVTFRGQALGAEINLSVSQLEDLVRYTSAKEIAKDSIGYIDTYSLANNAYWYVNEYEGIDLYKLLIMLGMDDAATMGLAKARTTLVSFIADDGFYAKESFSVDALSYPDNFGFYKKNSADRDDSSYQPTGADLESSGYPVLLAYGLNNYPYTITKNDDGYLSGLSNSGGPLRVVFGKTQYNHPNGSNQVQFVREVIVGSDLLYNTHNYTDNEDQKLLSDSEIHITVKGDDSLLLMDRTMTVAEVEDIIYGENVGKDIKKSAGEKNHYQRQVDNEYVSEIYEGINLEYFLLNVLKLPGTNGTVTFKGKNEESATVNLDRLLSNGYNTALARDAIAPIVAFAKNGSPLVEDSNSKGYIEGIELLQASEYDPDRYIVQNSGGPLAVFIPSTKLDECNAVSLMHLTEIEIVLLPDAYAHIYEPYSSYSGNTIRFFGEGLEKEQEYTVNDLISKQIAAKTMDFSLKDDKGNMFEARYRGLSIYNIFVEIGLNSNAGEVKVYDVDGNIITFSLSELRRNNYENMISSYKEQARIMLAFGAGIVEKDSMIGLPLVTSDTDKGYDVEFKNNGGPLKLIVPNTDLSIDNVVAVEVTANDIDSWGHSLSDVYSEFLSDTLTLTIKNDDNEWSRDFTIAELESMVEIIVREKYSVLDIGECEGIDIYRFIKRFAADVPGIEDPISITVVASDGYMNDLLSVFYLEGMQYGVPDDDGNRKPLIIAYAINGLPLVNSESHEGYTGIAGNTGGPLRVIAENTQGASVKYVVRLTVVVSGTEDIEKYINQKLILELEAG